MEARGSSQRGEEKVHYSLKSIVKRKRNKKRSSRSKGKGKKKKSEGAGNTSRIFVSLLRGSGLLPANSSSVAC